MSEEVSYQLLTIWQEMDMCFTDLVQLCGIFSSHGVYSDRARVRPDKILAIGPITD
jgi:hypothetical protein